MAAMDGQSGVCASLDLPVAQIFTFSLAHQFVSTAFFRPGGIARPAKGLGGFARGPAGPAVVFASRQGLGGRTLCGLGAFGRLCPKALAAGVLERIDSRM